MKYIYTRIICDIRSTFDSQLINFFSPIFTLCVCVRMCVCTCDFVYIISCFILDLSLWNYFFVNFRKFKKKNNNNKKNPKERKERIKVS